MAKNEQNSFAIRKTTTPQFADIKPRLPKFYEFYPVFSLKYYEHNHKEFSVQCIKVLDDFHDMFNRLQTMSQFKWKSIKAAPHVHHFHPINWADTSKPHGIQSLNIRFKESVPIWQFKNFKECRIIGFFNSDNIFEIVWIDRDHQVYPQK